MSSGVLTTKLSDLKNILIAVATGGPRIDDVNQEYKRLFNELDEEIRASGHENPIPYRDLWQWYGRWSSGDLPSYQSRRVHIGELVDQFIANLRSERWTKPPTPTGWVKVDRTIGKARDMLASAKNEEDFQVVGMLCRDAMISLAQAVFDPSRHRATDVDHLSDTDFKRMIEAYISVELAGGSSEELRKHARASFELANNTTHRRTANFVLAAICLEATTSVVNIIAIVSGRRG